MPVQWCRHGAVLQRDAVPARSPVLVHGLAESGECINQIVTVSADRGNSGPLRISLPLLRAAWKRDGQVMV